MIVGRGIDDELGMLPAQNRAGGHDMYLLKGGQRRRNEAVAMQGRQRSQVEVTRHAKRQQCLDLASEDQVALGRPVLDVVERMPAGEGATIDQRASLRHPIHYRWLVVALHGVSLVSKDYQPHPWLHIARRLPTMQFQHAFHRSYRLFNNLRWNLLTR